jgi:hypothetical protein
LSRLVFFSNWERTDTWIAAGRELARRGVEVFFVLTRDEYVRKALDAGFDRGRILWLTRGDAKRRPAGAEDLDDLAEMELATGERVRDMILMDRFLRSTDPEWSQAYAAYVFREVRDFLAANDIRLAVGQPDNVPDLMAAMIMQASGGRYAAPFEFRLPMRRFMLWDSKVELQPHVTGAATPEDVTAADLAEARNVVDRVRGGAKMRQVLTKAQAPRLGATFLRKLARGLLYRALVVSRHDVYMYTPRSVFFDLRYHLIPINYRRVRAAWRRYFELPVPGERFVFYTLNYAPEHTLDVEAPWFTSTVETVRNIVRTLPAGVKLYVKEHPVALGLRGPAELRALKRLPGVRLIDPHVDSHALIRDAELTVSLSGTASLEAALYGRPNVILSDIFIQNFSTCRRLEAPWQVGEALLAPAPEQDEEADMRYLAWLISNSHEGTVIEPLVDPTSLEALNVGRMADAFEKVLATSPRAD